jgi:hypothetical protein
MLRYDSSPQIIVAFFWVLIMLNGCLTMENDNYTDGFNYDYVGNVCPGTDVTAKSLFQSVAKKIEIHISEDVELRAAVGVVDLEEHTVIGYKSAGTRHLVQFLFGTFLRHDVILPGEGGILVVVDACSEKIVEASFFRMPT